jgi:hypothetical protein
MFLVIGFSEIKKGAPVCLYAGNDAEAATAVYDSPGAGVARVEFFRHPGPTRRRFIEASAPVVAAPAAPPEAPAEVEVEVEVDAEAPAAVDAEAPQEAARPRRSR